MPFERGNPHRFARGQSGNPGGISKQVAAAKKIAEKNARAAIEELVRLLGDPDSSIRFRAACEILNRSLGKPKLEVEHHDVGRAPSPVALFGISFANGGPGCPAPEDGVEVSDEKGDIETN